MNDNMINNNIILNKLLALKINIQKSTKYSIVSSIKNDPNGVGYPCFLKIKYHSIHYYTRREIKHSRAKCGIKYE